MSGLVRLNVVDLVHLSYTLSISPLRKLRRLREELAEKIFRLAEHPRLYVCFRKGGRGVRTRSASHDC